MLFFLASFQELAGFYTRCSRIVGNWRLAFPRFSHDSQHVFIAHKITKWRYWALTARTSFCTWIIVTAKKFSLNVTQTILFSCHFFWCNRSTKNCQKILQNKIKNSIFVMYDRFFHDTHKNGPLQITTKTDFFCHPIDRCLQHKINTADDKKHISRTFVKQPANRIFNLWLSCR